MSTSNVTNSNPILSFMVGLPDWEENANISIPGYGGSLTYFSIDTYTVCLYPTLQVFTASSSSSSSSSSYGISEFEKMINTYFTTEYPFILSSNFLQSYQTVFAFAYFAYTVAGDTISLKIGYNYYSPDNTYTAPYQGPSEGVTYYFTVNSVTTTSTPIDAGTMPYIFADATGSLLSGNAFSTEVGTLNAVLNEPASTGLENNGTIYIILTLDPVTSPVCVPVFAYDKVFPSLGNTNDSSTIQKLVQTYETSASLVVGIIPVTTPSTGTIFSSGNNDFCIMWITNNNNN